MSRFRTVARGEAGAAMIIVLALVTVLIGLGATVALTSASGLRAAKSDNQLGIAQNGAEAGLAQAIAYMRANGVGLLGCAPHCSASSGQPDWGVGPNIGGAGPNTTIAADSTAYGHLVTLSNGQSYRVWIEAISALNPPSAKTGLYTVHSEGRTSGAASGAGVRAVAEDVTVGPAKFPIGVFAHTVAAGGNGGIHYETLFSDSCIQGRQFTSFSGTDAYYGVPAAAHSADAIVTKQNSSCNQANSIHSSSACNSSYPNDTDLYGGPVSGAPCAGNGPTLNGVPWLTTSKETSFASMASSFGFDLQPKGLSNSQLDTLRGMAQQQGYYFTGSTAIPAALASANAHVSIPHPVLFYDLQGAAQGGTVDLSGLGGYSRSYPVSASDPACGNFGAVVVILNGNVKLNGNTVLVASVFAPGPYPNGQVAKANGGGQLIGTLYADKVDLRGTADVYLDNCFLQNLPGGLLNFGVSNYRESEAGR